MCLCACLVCRVRTCASHVCHVGSSSGWFKELTGARTAPCEFKVGRRDFHCHPCLPPSMAMAAASGHPPSRAIDPPPATSSPPTVGRSKTLTTQSCRYGDGTSTAKTSRSPIMSATSSRRPASPSCARPPRAPLADGRRTRRGRAPPRSRSIASTRWATRKSSPARCSSRAAPPTSSQLRGRPLAARHGASWPSTPAPSSSSLLRRPGTVTSVGPSSWTSMPLSPPSPLKASSSTSKQPFAKKELVSGAMSYTPRPPPVISQGDGVRSRLELMERSASYSSFR